MKRLFLGIPLPLEQNRQLQSFIEPYKAHPKVKGAKWVPAENFHLTTLFLGDVPDSLIPEVKSFARAVCAKIPRFMMTPKRVSLFPETGMAKMIWLKFERSLEYQELCSELLRFLKTSLPDLEVKESIAHLNLARLRTSVDGKALSFKPVEMDSFEVTESVLWESTLTPEGSVYTELERYPHDL